MKYNILTHDEFNKTYTGVYMSIQKYNLVEKNFIFSHEINNYKLNIGDILCRPVEHSKTVLFFIDEDCVIEFISYANERTDDGGKEAEIYDLTKDNKIITYKEAFEIASL